MSVLDNYSCEGQMSIFDLDIWFGKTSPEPLVQTTEKTSELYLKKLQELKIKPPLYLDLTKESGHIADASWEMGGALLGVYMMHSFGESPKEERESRLSQILEDNPHPKYSLSPKACQGILNRANRRGKKLPEQLENALIKQAMPLRFEGADRDSHGKTAGKGALIQTEKSGTLGVTQDQTLICIEGNGSRDSHKGICYSQDAYDKYGENQRGAALKASGGNYGGGTENLVVQ